MLDKCRKIVWEDNLLILWIMVYGLNMGYFNVFSVLNLNNNMLFMVIYWDMMVMIIK